MIKWGDKSEMSKCRGKSKMDYENAEIEKKRKKSNSPGNSSDVYRSTSPNTMSCRTEKQKN